MRQRFLTEEWRIVPGFPKYEASSLGRIRRLTGKRTKKRHKWIYYYYGYRKNTGYFFVGKKAVHDLVTAAFIGPKPPGKQVNHKDGVKTNNVPENLEYVTPAENARHAVEHGLYSNKNTCRFCKQSKSNHKPDCFLVLIKKKLQAEFEGGAIKPPKVKK